MALLPPHHQYRDFLDEEQASAVLDFALANELEFSPSTVASGGYNPERRISRRLLEMGGTRAWFEQKISSLLPDLFRKTGIPTFEVEHFELEIAAHGDGAHFATHTDIPIGWGRSPLGGDLSGKQDRLLSAVYYFYREPKAFSGGQLRLHGFGSNSEPGDYVDIEPERNSLVVFPPWVTHEVRTVRCPTGKFEDNRFAVNCWLCATRFA